MPENDILDWNARIEDDGSGEFTLLPPGEYTFRVTRLEYQRSSASNAPMAKVTLEVDYEGELVHVHDYLVLTKKAEWKLSSFFRSVGMKKHGEPFVMNWSRVVGAVGRARLHTEKFTKKDGSEGESNKVRYYIDAPSQARNADYGTGNKANAATSPPVPPPPPHTAYVNRLDEDDDGLI